MNAIVPLQAGRPPALFSQRKSSLNAAAQANIQASFAVIGYKGRNWRIKFRGEDQLLRDERNIPYPNLDVVIVGVSEGISKQFYEKKFTEGDDAAPDCFSVNGVTPDVASPKKQCTTCGVCPHNQWGSRVTEAGKKGKACQDSRRIAVVPLGDPENEGYGGPMLLRLPPMSLSNFANYGQLLERKGAGMEFVGTRLGFDYDVAYPRITFEAIGWLDDEQAAAIVGPDGNGGIMSNPLIERMLQEAVDEVTHDPASAAAQPAAADPLASGGPARAFQQQAAAAITPAPAPVQQAPAPVVQQAPAPAPQAAALAAPKRRSPFQTAAAAAAPAAAAAAQTAPVQQAPVQQAPVQQAPVQQAPAPVAQAPVQTAPVQQAPADLETAIDELLNM